MELKNNTILITGGTSGIGLAIAKRLSTDNKVIVIGRNQQKLEAVSKKYNMQSYQVDVSKNEDLLSLKKRIQDEYPDLNMVINSAGIMRPYDLFDEKVTPDDLMAEIKTNLMGTIAIDKIFLNHLVKQDEAMIVNVSSGLANISDAAHPVYSASKAGLHMFTDALRDQLQYANHDNVHVMELVPPLVSETNLEKVNTGSFGNMRLSKLVDAAIKGMTKNSIRVNAGFSKVIRKAGQIAPDMAEHQIAKQSISQYFPDGL